MTFSSADTCWESGQEHPPSSAWIYAWVLFSVHFWKHVQVNPDAALALICIKYFKVSQHPTLQTWMEAQTGALCGQRNKPQFHPVIHPLLLDQHPHDDCIKFKKIIFIYYIYYWHLQKVSNAVSNSAMSPWGLECCKDGGQIWPKASWHVSGTRQLVCQEQTCTSTRPRISVCAQPQQYSCQARATPSEQTRPLLVPHVFINAVIAFLASSHCSFGLEMLKKEVKYWENKQKEKLKKQT